MDYAPFKIPSRMAGDFSYRSVIPPFRKKSRLLRLCPCKCWHDASVALPTFCRMREGSNCLLKNIRDSFYLVLTPRNGLRSIKNPQPFGWGFFMPICFTMPGIIQKGMRCCLPGQRRRVQPKKIEADALRRPLHILPQL